MAVILFEKEMRHLVHKMPPPVVADITEVKVPPHKLKKILLVPWDEV